MAAIVNIDSLPIKAVEFGQERFIGDLEPIWQHEAIGVFTNFQGVEIAQPSTFALYRHSDGMMLVRRYPQSSQQYFVEAESLDWDGLVSEDAGQYDSASLGGPNAPTLAEFKTGERPVGGSVEDMVRAANPLAARRAQIEYESWLEEHDSL